MDLPEPRGSSPAGQGKIVQLSDAPVSTTTPVAPSFRRGRGRGRRGPTEKLGKLATRAEEEVWLDETIPAHRKIALLAALDLIQSDRPMSRKAGIEMYSKLMGYGPEQQIQESRAEVMARRRNQKSDK